MSKVTKVVDSLNHNAGLVKELIGKDSVRQAETMLRETRDKVAAEVLSKKASDAIKASVSPQVKKPTFINVVKDTGIPGQKVSITSSIGGNPEDIVVTFFNDGIASTTFRTTLNRLPEYGLNL